MTNGSWAKELSHRVGQEARRLRGSDRSVQWLSDRTAELGHRVGRSRISDLERGDRGGVLDVAELIVLAKALAVPPLQLLFPVGREPLTEVLPTAEIPTWAAAKWFTGEGSFPVRLNDGGWGADTEDYTAWKAGVPLLFRQLDELYDRWADARREAGVARDAAARAATTNEREALIGQLQLREELLRRAEDEIRRQRDLIRARGLDPGELSPEFVHLDTVTSETDADR